MTIQKKNRGATFGGTKGVSGKRTVSDAKKSSGAVAHSNIGLAKYWGKSDVALNLPAVPSLSLTLSGMATETRVVFDAALRADSLVLNGKPASASDTARVAELLGRVRKQAKTKLFARVVSANNFPTASGLASSASGFAALAGAALAAAQQPVTPAAVSRLARASSASAARSVFEGFAELPAGKPGDRTLTGRPVAPADYWDVRLVVAVMTEARKAIGSTAGMERSRKTSPYYDAWIAAAPGLYRTIRRGVLAKDIDAVGQAMEQSTFAFHACTWTSRPSFAYWKPATLAAVETVRRLRDEHGVAAYVTMDAGPHVKVLCLAKDAARVSKALAATEGVLRTLTARPGPGLVITP